MKHSSEDLALISPIIVFDDLKNLLLSKAAEIGTSGDFKGLEILGSCFYINRDVYNRGNILERFLFNGTTHYESDIGGTKGFSKCGYYNLRGKLSFRGE